MKVRAVKNRYRLEDILFNSDFWIEACPEKGTINIPATGDLDIKSGEGLIKAIKEALNLLEVT